MGAAANTAEAAHLARLSEVQRALDAEVANRRAVQGQVRRFVLRHVLEEHPKLMMNL